MGMSSGWSRRRLLSCTQIEREEERETADMVTVWGKEQVMEIWRWVVGLPEGEPFLRQIIREEFDLSVGFKEQDILITDGSFSFIG